MKVIYQDYETNEVETFYNVDKKTIGPNHFSYHDNQENVEIKYNESEVLIQRKAELTFDLRLILRRRTHCEMFSSSGVISLETYTLDIIVAEKCLEVEYYLLAQEEIVAHKKVKFEFEH